MAWTSLSPRRATAAALGVAALVLAPVATASAEPPPNCSAADLSGVLTGVMASTTAYLYTHPPVNDFFTSLAGMDQEQKKVALADFLEANPEVKAELQAIRQPSQDFRSRCG